MVGGNRLIFELILKADLMGRCYVFFSHLLPFAAQSSNIVIFSCYKNAFYIKHNFKEIVDGECWWLSPAVISCPVGYSLERSPGHHMETQNHMRQIIMHTHTHTSGQFRETTYPNSHVFEQREEPGVPR